MLKLREPFCPRSYILNYFFVAAALCALAAKLLLLTLPPLLFAVALWIRAADFAVMLDFAIIVHFDD